MINTHMLWPVILYALFVLSIAVVATYQNRVIRHGFLEDYLLANRSMGGIVFGMTLTASYISASSFIGGPGAAYRFGLGWVWLAMIQVPAAWLALGLLGKRISYLSKKYQALTLNDLLYVQYRHKGVVVLASLALLSMFFAAMVVQFMGAARLLENLFGISYQSGLISFALLCAVYTSVGGFRAVILTDLVQGCVMILGTLVLFFTLLSSVGGISEAMVRLRDIDPLLLSPSGPDHKFNVVFMGSFWILICFGVMGLPHTTMRCMAYKDSKALHQAMIISTVVFFVIMFGMHMSGVLGRVLLPGLEVPDHIIPQLMIHVLPTFAAAVFLTAPLAAMMSSVDSMLIQSSSTLIKDLYGLFSHRGTTDKYLKRASMICSLLLSFFLILAAWNPPDMLIWLNLLALGGLQVIFLWPLVLGLFFSNLHAWGALSSMLCGASSYIILHLIEFKPMGLHPVVPSLLIGIMMFVLGHGIGSSVENKKSSLA
jgi:sodium/pantothenate symporter